MAAEQLAYWFLRLNGFTTITSFVVHPDSRGGQRTEVDILATRLPYRCELLTSGEPMADHKCFDTGDKVDVIIAEAKTSRCSLNGPCSRPEDDTLEAVLYAIGAVPPGELPSAAAALYREEEFEHELCRIRLFAFGQ